MARTTVARTVSIGLTGVTLTAESLRHLGLSARLEEGDDDRIGPTARGIDLLLERIVADKAVAWRAGEDRGQEAFRSSQVILNLPRAGFA